MQASIAYPQLAGPKITFLG